MTEQGYRLGSIVTSGWVGSQAVLPNKDGATGYIPCSGESQAELCGPIWPQSVLCDQVGQEAILRVKARTLARLCHWEGPSARSYSGWG